MKNVEHIIFAFVTAFAILGLPILTCLSFVLEWDSVFRVAFIAILLLEVVFVAIEVWERIEE